MKTIFESFALPGDLQIMKGKNGDIEQLKMNLL
jgi:hypothetical protein